MIEAARVAGLLPHEFLAAVARGECVKVPTKSARGKVVLVEHYPTFEQMVDAAKAAAPYLAPRLSAVALRHRESDNPWEEILNIAKAGNKNRATPKPTKEPTR